MQGESRSLFLKLCSLELVLGHIVVIPHQAAVMEGSENIPLCRKWCKFLEGNGGSEGMWQDMWTGVGKEKRVGVAGMHITSFVRKEDNKHLCIHMQPHVVRDSSIL